MPAKDIYHDTVKQALVKDGWTITHDPLRLKWGKKDLYVDLGAERLLGAEKGESKIAVESKSFIGESDMEDLEKAIGQYIVYDDVLHATQPDRTLFLAIRDETLVEVFEDDVGKLVLEKQHLRLLVFDAEKAEIIKWIP